MTLYIFNLAAIGAWALYGAVLSRIHRNPTLLYRRLSWAVAAQLLLILALRGQEVGSDVARYVQHFEGYGPESTDLSRYEPGYLQLIRLVKVFTDNSSVFLGVVAVVCVVPLAVWISRESVQPLFSWFIYVCLGFYAFTFSGLRQAIAFGLTAIAMLAIRQQRLVRFVLMVALAATFHATALLFVPAYWIFRIRLSRSWLMVVVLLSGAVFAFRESIFVWFATRFYDSYTVTASDSFTWLTFSAILALGICLRLDAMRIEDSGRIGYVNLTIMGVLLMIFASVGTNAMRVAEYYFHAIVVALPLALSTLPGKWKTPVQAGVLVLLIAVYLFEMSSSPYSIVPYSDIFG